MTCPTCKQPNTLPNELLVARDEIKCLQAQLAESQRERDRYRGALQQIDDYPIHSAPMYGAMEMMDMAHDALKGDAK